MIKKPIPSYREIRKRADNKEIKCESCGLCCELAAGSINCSHGDIRLWLDNNRDDILKYVKFSLDEDGNIEYFDSDIWIDPDSKFDLLMNRCPFLEVNYENGFRCKIYDLRPIGCKNFEFKGIRCIKYREDFVSKFGRKSWNN